MYVKLICPSCGKGLKVKEELAGQRARCPHCKAPITIPEAAPAPAGGVDWQSIVTTPQGPAEKAKAAPNARASNRTPGGTHVSVLWSGLIGLAAAILYLALMFPLRGLYFGAVFIQRGWVPYVETLLFFWAVAFLVFKWMKLRQQRDAMLFDLLPTEIDEEITASNVERFLEHVHATTEKVKDSVLVHRVQRGLEHFKVRQSNPEVAALLSSQSDIDANAVSTSYTIVKVFIWAIPILGFIGTVIGIGAAVAGLSSDISSAEDMAALKGSLGAITSGLGVAFDTTLVALVMSILLRFPADALEKAESDLLNEVDDYCNENLVLRLRDGGQHASSAPNDAGRFTDLQRELVKIAEQNLHALVDNLNKSQTLIAEQFSNSIAGLATKAENAQRTVELSMQEAARTLQSHFAAVERGVASLSSVLSKLGQERIVVEVHPKPRRLWSLFRRNNGARVDG